MIDGTGLRDTSQVAGTLAGTKINQVEQLARRGDLRKASQEFESYFVSYLLKVMRETVPQGELTANKMGEMFYSFYDEEIGRRAAEAGGIGLSDYVLAAVARNEDLAHAPSNPPFLVKS
ncbi:MAG: rod-binding protein [Nitrospirota bacterium]|nr:rod-binding protein [Nitrospirota bacterium]MDH5586566.1 rod-binding protein [Nitrospirota bacterium]MDH5775766.1 rod-binding protein [Nitrospirota bacterium]